MTGFDEYRGKGTVRVGGDDVEFDETCFRSGRPIRAPRLGEGVDVVFTTDGLLSVRVPESAE